MTMLFIPDAAHMERPKGGIDWIGLGMMSAGLASLQYLLERGQHDDWYQSPLIWTLTVVAVTGILGFIFREIRDRAPLVDLSVFKHRTSTIGNIFGVVSGFGLFGTSLILPLFLQTVMGMTAFDTGMALLPGAIATAISMVIEDSHPRSIRESWWHLA